MRRSGVVKRCSSMPARTTRVTPRYMAAKYPMALRSCLALATMDRIASLTSSSRVVSGTRGEQLPEQVLELRTGGSDRDEVDLAIVEQRAEVGREVRGSRSLRLDGAGHLVGQATRAVEHDDGSPLPKVLHELGHGRRSPADEEHHGGTTTRDGGHQPGEHGCLVAPRPRGQHEAVVAGSERDGVGTDPASAATSRAGATPTTAAGRSGADDRARPSRWNTPASVPP